jgi:type IV pilus assembly protein PilQ
MKSRRFGLLAVSIVTALVLGANVQAQTASGSAPTESVASNSIDTLTVTQQSGNTIIKVGLKQPLAAPPSSFSVASPARVVFDFGSTANGLNRTVQQVNEGDLRSVNIVQVGDRTRLVLNLKKTGGYQGQAEGNTFVVTLAPSAGEAVVPPTVQHFPPTTVKAAEVPSVRDIKFRRGKAGEGLVTVELSDASTGIDVKQQGQSLIVDFQGAQLPENLRRKLDVTDFATPVTTVNAMPQGKNARLVITPQGLWEHTAYQSDNQFVVEVKPLKEDPSKIFQGSQRQGYQGEKVSLNFQNIPLRELLHVFADITNFNIVISDTVTGNVSLRLNDVPWDQALDIVLQQKGLSMRKNGNVIWIAPSDELAAREKLDLESKQVIADLEPVRTESFQLNYQKADVLGNVLLGGLPKGVTLPQGAKPQRMLSDRGSVLFDTRTNKLFISDTPTKLAEIRRLLGEVDVPVRQVLIEARIVEADNSFSKSLGARIGVNDGKGLALGGHQLGNARWGVSATNSDANKILPYGPSRVWVPTGRITDFTPAVRDAAGNITTPSKATFEETAPIGSVPFNESQAVNLAATNAAGTFAFTLFNKSMTMLLGLEISAMEADGKGKTISSPRVLTADQIEATIEDGQEIPYWSASSSGATTVSYRKAVLSLKVRPQITPDGRVIMTVHVNKDSVNTALSTSYGLAINTKNVQTEVLVDNGGTVVIGGIYVQEEMNTVTRVPVLGDIPLLGYMFRKTDKTDNRRELLVFLTPKIVSETLSMR